MSLRVLVMIFCLAGFVSDDALAQSRVKTNSRSTLARKAKLRCSPQKLFLGDTLILDMTTPHGGQLAIRAPDGTDFFVVYEPHDEGSAALPLMNAEDFMKLGQLKLITDQTKAKPWVYGRDKNELIFTRTGWYQVRLSENLETDDGTPVYQCKVYYRHRSRP